MVAQVRMQPILVVEYCDVLKNIVLRLLASLIMLPLNALLLEATEETLNHCVSQQFPLRLMLPLN